MKPAAFVPSARSFLRALNLRYSSVYDAVMTGAVTHEAWLEYLDSGLLPDGTPVPVVSMVKAVPAMKRRTLNLTVFQIAILSFLSSLKALDKAGIGDVIMGVRDAEGWSTRAMQSCASALDELVDEKLVYGNANSGFAVTVKGKGRLGEVRDIQASEGVWDD